MSIGNMLERAKDAASRRNYALAIEIYLQALAIEPDHGDARRALRETVRKKVGPKRGGLGAKIGGLGSLFSMKLGGISKKHGAVIEACEKYLTKDPYNVDVNFRLGEAAVAAGYTNAAVVAFEAVTDMDPQNVEGLKELGRLFHHQRDINRALRYYEKALEIAPQDRDALQARKNLAAEGALEVTGLASATHSRDLIKDKDQAMELERAKRRGLSEDDTRTEIRRLEDLVAQSPGDLGIVRQLADRYAASGLHEPAIRTYERLLEEDPNNPTVVERISDIRIRQHDETVRKAKQAAAAQPDDPAAQAALAAAREEGIALRIEEYERRVRAHPTDLGLHFELGRQYQAAGRLDDAIAAFQKTIRDPKRKVESLSMLGRAFHQKGMLDLAAKQFEKALEDAATLTDPVKEVVYLLADVYEKQGKSARALEQFSRIYEVDINFRDVQERVAALSA